MLTFPALQANMIVYTETIYSLPLIRALSCSMGVLNSDVSLLYLQFLLHFTHAVVNMCLGAYTMFRKITPLLWVCVGYSAFIAVVVLVLGALFKCSCRKKGE